MKRITQFFLCLVLAVSGYGQGVGGNSVPRTVSGISAALDLISSTQGTIFYRGASGWEAMPPGTSGQLFSTQGAAANPIWVTATGGAGDVNGPTLGTATDNAIVRFDGTGGKTVQNSAVTIADTTGAMTWAAGQDASLSGGSSGASLVLGSGTTSPYLQLRAAGRFAVNALASNDAYVEYVGNAGTAGTTSVVVGQSAGGPGIIYNRSNAALTFGTNSLERGRFTETGNLLIGTTTDMASTAGGLTVAATGSGATATAVNTGGLRSANFGLSTVLGGASYFEGSVIAGGTVAAPGLAVDADNGLYRKGTDNIGLALNGALAIDMDDGVKRIDIQSAFTFRAQGAAQVNGVLNVANTTSATNTTSGALVVGSNVGLSGNAGGASYFGGAVTTNGNLIISRTGALADAKATLNGVGANGGAILELNSATGGNIYSYASHQQAGVEKWMTGMHASFSASGYIIRDSVNSVTVATFNAGATPSVSFGGVTILKNYTVATLPAAASYTYGTAFVSDATNAAGTGGGTAPTGGGAVKRLVYSDGTNWLLQ